MTVAPGHAEDAPAQGDQPLVAIEQVASLPVERQVAWLRRAAPELFEKFSFMDVTTKNFDGSAFDPKNPEYKF